MFKKFILKNQFILNIILGGYVKLYTKFNKDNNILKSYINIKKLEKYIVIEDRVEIDSTLQRVGTGTYINQNTMINNCKAIGRFCSIATGVKIGMGSHPKTWVSTSPLFYSPKRGLVTNQTYDNLKCDKPVLIENDVWIGSNAIIMPGVKLGNGCIVGAGSIVTKDVPEYAIVIGVPAKVKSYRFDQNIIDDLVKSEWWNNDLDTIIDQLDNIDNPQIFLKNIE